MTGIGTRPHRIALTVVAGVLSAILLAGAAPVQERATSAAPVVRQAIMGPAITSVDEPRLERHATNLRLRAIVMVTGLDIRVASHIVAEADRYGLRDEVLVGLIAHETGYTFDQELIVTNTNGTKDHGLMQLNSGTYPWLARMLGLVDVDPLEPLQNIQMGVWYLNQVLTECHNNLHCALSRYNGDRTGRYALHVSGVIDRYASLLMQAKERAGREQHKPQPKYGRAA